MYFFSYIFAYIGYYTVCDVYITKNINKKHWDLIMLRMKAFDIIQFIFDRFFKQKKNLPGTEWLWKKRMFF